MSKSVQFQVFFGGLANINRYLILLVDGVCFISDPDTDITSLIKGLEEEKIFSLSCMHLRFLDFYVFANFYMYFVGRDYMRRYI